MSDACHAKTPLLFVYGTLMSDRDNAMAALLTQHATKIGHATFQGKMYRVSRPDGSLVYPAVTPSDVVSDQVHGEVYELPNPDILPLLDDYEACGTQSPEPHEYQRNMVDVTVENNTPVRAYIYLYALPTTSLEPIPSGSFPKI